MDLATLEPFAQLEAYRDVLESRMTGIVDAYRGCSCAKTTERAMNDGIDELLGQWWWWSHESEPVKGYADTAAGFGEYRSGWRDSADLADAAEDRARDAISEAVDFCVASIDLRARIAINTEMRNRYSGARVWTSIRLPADLAGEYARAKELLRPALEARFLIDPL